MRRIAALVLLASLLAALLAGVAQARVPLKGPGYRASAPSGWHKDKTSGNGWNSVTIIAPQRRSALVSIAVASAKTIKKTGIDLGDKNKLIQQLISVPSDKFGLQTAFGPQPTTLAGKRGVTMGVTYNTAGHGTTHSATLVRRGQRFFLIQVITDEDVTFLGQSAVDSIRKSWRWK